MTEQPVHVRAGAGIDAASLKIWHLKSCPLFARLGEGEIGALFDATQLVSLGPGESVPSAPSDEPSVWVVKRGYVKLTYIDAEGRDGAILILSPGDLFGALHPEAEAIFGESCSAMTGACLVRLTRRRFDKLMMRFPDLAYRVTKANFDRIHRLQVRVNDLLTRSVEERLAIVLLELDKTIGEECEEGGREFSLPVSHRELAQLVGSSREMVTHVMARLRKLGMVETSRRKHIRLLDPEGLRSLRRA